ncbi:hypothetical protein GCM10023219_08770 [Stakelama sediminis]|uniref:Chitooligosaccharide deacetylase n=1 Tax=Stakelama sediminis TaxID=463200 RepID=A0A840YVM7_9SPHN|nr:polysaccharide deacetylase family protein [Stakelama sediminis]MBB5717599.1 peptidoglycan/xylan/chitin deacetylase (PgdA/CDA1 family) [Stakelama sediminis]
MAKAFFTIDTELAWRHHAANLPLEEIVERSLEPAGVGVSWQLEKLAEHDLKATFFVDPMPALLYGLEPIRQIVETILDAGQEVQLHLHANWGGAKVGDGGAAHGAFELTELNYEEQRNLIAGATELLVAAGAPQPIAFRSGSYSANDDTLAALSDLGFDYDSSHNGSEHPWPSAIDLPPEQVAPVEHHGVAEVPVTVIEDRPGRLRHFQICALSAREMRAALDHAIAENHATTTIVGHGFELANRAGTRANKIHVRRFESLCRMLSDRRDTIPTTHFTDLSRLRLGSDDKPLGPSMLRTGWRQAEQLWSNLVEERPA